MSQTIQVGRHLVYRRFLESMKMELQLYATRRARRNILRAQAGDRDPRDYDSYRSPQTDALPGAPGQVSDPTGTRAVGLIETQELAFLEAWVEAVEMILEGRLDPFQQFIIQNWVMVPAAKRKKTFGETIKGRGYAERESWYRLNEALLEFAFALVGEDKILCRDRAVSTAD